MDNPLTAMLDKPEEQTEDQETSIPGFGDPEWSDYVMQQFKDNELFEGFPKVNGLRRVTHVVLGPILESYSDLIQAPQVIHNSGERSSAISRHCVTVKTPYGIMKYGDIGEAKGTGNEPTLQGKFAAFEISISATRAEARTLRKLLHLNTVAHEERMDVDSNAFDNQNSTISAGQIKTIEKFCKELDVDVYRFINMSRNKYKQIKDVPRDRACKMIETLQEWKASNKVPDKVKNNYEEPENETVENQQ